MSIAALCSIHRINVLADSGEKTPGLASARRYGLARGPLLCRVIPLSVRKELQLGNRTVMATHRIRFAADPGPLDERHRVEWLDVSPKVVMDVTGAPYNAHGVNRIWTMYADASGLLNASQDTAVSGAEVE